MNQKFTNLEKFKNNIEAYGSPRLKNLLLLAETEDLKKQKIEDLLFEVMIPEKQNLNFCWFDENKFQKNLLTSLHLSNEEQNLFSIISM